MFKLNEVVAQYVSEFSVSRPPGIGNVILLANPTLEHLPGLLHFAAVIQSQSRFLPTTLDITEDSIYAFFTDIDQIADSEDERDEMVADVLSFLIWSRDKGYLSDESANALIDVIHSLPDHNVAEDANGE